MVGGASQTCRIEFGDSGNDDIGKIYYDNSDNSMQFTTNTAERLRITSDGYALLTTANARLEWTASSGSNPFIRSIGTGQQELEFNAGGSERLRITSGGEVQIANGNLKFSTSGTGIDFSATSDGSGTATSELLDDYEEGTWTATYYGATTAGTYTHSGGSGAYTKIGDTVNLIVDIKNLNEVSAGTGLLRIGGLPFQPSNGNEAGSVILENFTFPSTVEYACLRTSTSNYLMLVGVRNSGVDVQFNVTDRDNNTSDIFGQITYKTNS
jgi:hypothetical protein